MKSREWGRPRGSPQKSFPRKFRPGNPEISSRNFETGPRGQIPRPEILGFIFGDKFPGPETLRLIPFAPRISGQLWGVVFFRPGISGRLWGTLFCAPVLKWGTPGRIPNFGEYANMQFYLLRIALLQSAQ